jgi:hypothetical protein
MINGILLKAVKFSEKRVLKTEPAVMKRLAAFCGNPLFQACLS